jgi:hypothetical protein
MKNFRVIAVLVGMVSGMWCPALGQMAISETDFGAIPFAAVRNWLMDRNETLHHYKALRPSCDEESDLRKFSRCTKTYIIRKQPDSVMAAYLSVNPMISWHTRKSVPGLLYDRNKDALYYPGQDAGAAEPGKVLFLNLKLLKGLYSMATAIEITDVGENVVEFGYPKSGRAEGKQELRFESTPRGNTRVVHTCWVYSGSKIRDKMLYPFFHKRLINSFHRKMERTIKEGSKG